MAYSITDKQNAIKSDLSDLKNKYVALTNSLQTSESVPELDAFNYKFLWDTNNAIMDIYAAYYAEMTAITGITVKGQDGVTAMPYTKVNWDTQMSNASLTAGDGTGGLWPTNTTTAINTTSPLLIRNGMGNAATQTNFGSSTSMYSAANTAISSMSGSTVTGSLSTQASSTTITLGNVSFNYGNVLYTAAPSSITITGNATTTPPTIGLSTNKSIVSISITSGGSGFTNGTYTGVTFSNGTGSGGVATVIVTGGAVTAVIPTTMGSYTVGPTAMTGYAGVVISCNLAGTITLSGSWVVTTAVTTASIVVTGGTTVQANYATIYNNLVALRTSITSSYSSYLTTTKNTLTAFIANSTVSSSTTGFTDSITSSAIVYPTQLDTYINTLTSSTNLTTVSTYIGNNGGLPLFYTTSRFATLMGYIGADALSGLNKWRTFWINERINRSTGTQTQTNSMSDLQTKTLADIGSLPTPGTTTKLYSALSLIGGTTIMPTQSILAAYYNPLLNEVDATIISNSVAILWDGRNHATSYTLYRKTISSQANIGTALITGEWTIDGTVTSTNVNTVVGKYITTKYNDSTVAANSIYVYRVIMSDNSIPWAGTTYTSLQSPTLGSPNTVSSFVQGNIVSGTLPNYIYITFATNHGYSVGQIIRINISSSYYIIPVAKVISDTVISVKSTDTTGATLKDLLGTVIPISLPTDCTIVNGLVKTSF